MIQAVASRSVTAVKYLLSIPPCFGLDVNLAGHGGWTALLLACEQCQTEIVKVLLEDDRCQVNLGLPTDGTTPFFIACQMGDVETARLFLRDDRCQINRPIMNGTTPFHIAAEFDKPGVVELLLADRRVDINFPRTNGATAFFMIAQKGLAHLVKLLMADPRIDVNKGKDNGATPFIIACQKGMIEVVKLLLADPRVDCNTPLPDGHTPLAIAAGFNQVEVLQHLIASGKDLDTRAAINLEVTATLDVLTEWLEFLRSFKKPYVVPEDIARGKNHLQCLELIQQVEADPAQTRYKLFHQLRLGEGYAAELFALVIFVGDDYLAFRNAPKSFEVLRFFRIARRLPLEMQMILCHRVFGSTQDLVPKKLAEQAFKLVTWKLTLQRAIPFGDV